ncbi:hypothetical protein HNY73_007192 [Argiope bruennichi]|uniref:Uncharacterized protein n=1 Tax=Argiope bruennichi TaxID=94029 RepID=A0A8T0FE76_ARGBR|nr:hypothetical protein HNY73_007192 [Argiope bruennichi]
MEFPGYFRHSSENGKGGGGEAARNAIPLKILLLVVLIKKNFGAGRLPTFQIDTVPSPPWSPVEDPLDEESIDIQLEEEPQSQSSDSIFDDQRDSLRSFIEDIISKAMVVAEKKLQFVGLDDDDEEEEEEVQQQVEEEVQPPQEVEEEVIEAEEEKEAELRLTEEEEAEIRAAAEKVVEEVLSKAEEVVTEQMVDTSKFNFPGLPVFQIDTVKSAPPSPEEEEKPFVQPKKYTFRLANEDEERSEPIEEQPKVTEEPSLITFDEAPDDVKDVASNLIKEIVGKAITMAEEKSIPTVPFNFEDVDLIKSSGPWYVRVREGFMRVLRTACFCTPRRHDS